MKLSLILVIILFQFSNCAKEKKDIQYTKYTYLYYTYNIELTSDLKISKVSYYRNNANNTITFDYFADKIIVKREGSFNYISYYYLNSFGIADSSIDSVFNNNIFSSLIKKKYEYDSNLFLISEKVTAPADNLLYGSNDRIYSDGNLITIKYSSFNEVYTYYLDLLNKIDINNMIGNIKGKNSINLLKTSRTGGGPIYDYYYEIDDNNFITKEILKHTYISYPDCDCSGEIYIETETRYFNYIFI